MMLPQYNSGQRDMARIWRQSELTTLHTSIQHSTVVEEHVARNPSAQVESASIADQALHFQPFTTHIIAVITEPAQSEIDITRPISTLIQDPGFSDSTILSLSASITHSSYNATATFVLFASPSASTRLSISNVGTVVSETEIPKSWRAKEEPDQRSRHRTIFWVVVILMFGLTFVGIVAIR
ncbi:hypothetical protein FB567DRAFT_320515 [Paraphoma chrysanthemicola]|uniref:Uncharacterized protein n=1 Tax=Paraphoma chrysanthemicola TaxID=798071 RepID=A0A8K0R7X8_9PLEO|nr:hypothetical protein FB567DRAFT_320515 [Paraphoma chrysanthemicola]